VSDNVYDRTPAAKSLILGALPLSSPGTKLAGKGYELEVLASDASFGNGDPIEQEVRSFLLDGARVNHLRDGNRESFFQVRVEALTPIALAEAEADIRAELGKINRLRWTPPHQGSPVSVFVVVTSSMRWLFDDHAETQLRRIFGLRFVCLPHVRSDFEVTVPALATPPGGAPTVTSINACTATTGWTGSSTPTTDAASIIIKPADDAQPHYWPPCTRWALLTRSAFNPVPYICVTARASKGKLTDLRVEADGVALQRVLVKGNDWFFLTADTSVTTFKITGDIGEYLTTTTVPQALYVDDVSSYNKLPVFGTGRQNARSIEVLGSERTPGTIELVHGSSLGGIVMVYTYADDSGYTPELSTDFISGTAAAVGTNISGQEFTTGTQTFEKPLSEVPDGRYELNCVLSTSVAGSGYTVTWTARVYVGGGAVGEQLSGTVTGAFAGGDSRMFLRLGRLLLPPTKVPDANTTATLRVTIAMSAPANKLDEAWLFNLTIGELTVVDVNSKWALFLDSASLEDLAPAIYAGTAADRSNAHALSKRTDVFAAGRHVFPPGRVQVFTVTETGVDVPVSFRYPPCWSHHPALLTAP